MQVAYQYDAAGNLINDGSHTYTYDAEGRMIQVDGGSTATYVYDALGQRVKKTVAGYPTEYMYTLDGQIDSLMEGFAGHLTRGFVYLNGRPLVEYANGTTYFVHTDHLGSTRLLTNYPTPTVAESDDYYPFGEFNSSGSTSALKFNADERDSESGLDHTLFRQYSSSLGRWTSPDPAGLLATDASNPQSWNGYTYVLNNPLSYTDPMGLWCTWDDGTHDDPVFDGGVDAVGCGQAGGTWSCDPGAICVDGRQGGDSGPGSFGAGTGGAGLTPLTPLLGPDLGGGGVGGGPVILTTMQAETNWFNTNKPACLWAGAKEAIGGLVLKKEIDAVANVLLGDSNAVPGTITPGAVAFSSEQALERIADNRPLILTIRTALRDEGWRVSGNALARGAKFLGKAALVTHIGFALSDGVDAYNACREN